MYKIDLKRYEISMQFTGKIGNRNLENPICVLRLFHSIMWQVLHFVYIYKQFLFWLFFGSKYPSLSKTTRIFSETRTTCCHMTLFFLALFKPQPDAVCRAFKCEHNFRHTVRSEIFCVSWTM